MISKIFRKKISKKILIPIGKKLSFLDPNLITTMTYPLVFIAFYFLYKKNYLLGLVFVILSTLMDNLDGAIAKASGKKSDFGSYYDAITDKIHEIIILSSFALTGYPLEAFFAISSSLLLSYAKPRAEMVKPLGNPDWPSIGERAERLIIIMCILILEIFGMEVISKGLIFLSIICIIGFIQRFLYAKNLLVRGGFEPPISGL